MTDANDKSARLTEEAAHRLLARAVELDASRGTELTVAQLRDAARDAGISNAAFDAALHEWESGAAARREPQGRVAQWHHRSIGTQLRNAVNGASVRNLLALGAFWAVLVIVVSFDRTLGVHWLVRKASDPIAMAIGAAIAARLRARPVSLLLAGLAVSQGAEFVMDAALGSPSIPGFGPHLALMIAGVVGVLLGGRFFGRPPQAHAAAMPVTEEAEVAPRAPGVEQKRALGLRWQGA